MADGMYDLVVIGAGSGGVRAARMAAGLGAKVAVAEDAALGGTCVNLGCIPKKLYSFAAHYAEAFEEAHGYGWPVVAPAFDWPLLKANRAREITRLNGIYENLLVGSGVTLLRGRAQVQGPHHVEVGGRRVSGRHLLVATGGRPVVPLLPGRELPSPRTRSSTCPSSRAVWWWWAAATSRASSHRSFAAWART